MTLITLITVPCSMLLVAWVMSGRFQLNSHRTLFLCIAAYFGLCVPFDLVVGFDVRGARGFMADLNSPMFWGDVLTILLFYVQCVCCFLLTYRLVQIPRTQSLASNSDSKSLIQIPEKPMFLFVLGIFLLFMVVYFGVFGSLSRADRALASRESPLYKAVAFGVPFIHALGLLFILRCKNKMLSLQVVALVILFSVATGHRMWGTAYVLFFLFRYEVKMTRTAILFAAILFVSINLAWKATSYHFRNTGELAIQFDQGSETGLSRFEGIQSWVNATETIHDQESPNWLGWSYTILPLDLALPRFLRENPPQTLADRHCAYFRPAFYETGGGIGFSAIAESWLNFGIFGPGLLGIAWGFAAKYFDTRPRGIGYIIFFIMTMRLFRSDFGSLFKSWVLMFGAALVVSEILFWIAQSIASRPGLDGPRTQTIRKRKHTLSHFSR